MIDPATHRADWLIRSRIDGRRSNAAYMAYPDAARALQPASRKHRSPASPLKGGGGGAGGGGGGRRAACLS
jgi:hypothetical protein